MYLCRLESGHDGPCTAPEVGPSQIARAKWERQQKSAVVDNSNGGGVSHETVEQPMMHEFTDNAPVPDPEPAPAPEQTAFEPDEVPALRWARTHDDRVALALMELAKPFDDLAPAVRSWVRGAQAQLALVELWEATKGGPVTLSREDLVGLVPEYLQTN
jgi:hypothetical protein